MNENEIINETMDNIIKRTNGDWNNLTLSDKLILKQMYININKQIMDSKPIIDFWCHLDIENEILKEKNSEIGKLDWLMKKSSEEILTQEFRDKREKLRASEFKI